METSTTEPAAQPQEQQQVALETRGLTRRFRARWLPGRGGRRAGITAVDDVSLSLERGAVLGLVGPNGAGKTTLMRLVLDQLVPDAGEVRVLGERHTRLGDSPLRRVGALIEEPRFLPHLSARDNLWQVAMLRGVASEETIASALDDVGLAARGRDRVGTFSLGMRQRLGLARCLLGDPELLVLDEPTNGMDPDGIAETRELVRRLARERGMSVLLSSHHLAGIEQLCDRVAFMAHGRIVETGTLAELAGTATAWTIEVGRAGEAAAALEAHAAESGRETFAVSVGPDGERLHVTSDDPGAGADCNAALVAAGFRVTGLEREARDLEAIYRDVIGDSRRWKP